MMQPWQKCSGVKQTIFFILTTNNHSVLANQATAPSKKTPCNTAACQGNEGGEK